MSRGFPTGKFGRRNTRRTQVAERNIPMLGRLIEAAHGPAPAKAEGGELAASRIGGNDTTAAYLLKRLPNQMAHLQAERCHPRPSCTGCPVRHFCATWRGKHEEAPKSTGTIIELFSGAGGMSLGFEEAGFTAKLAVDADQDAVHTYAANRPWMTAEQVQCKDIRELMKDGTFAKMRGKVDGVVGGPPCQTFSLVGYRTKTRKDESGKQVGHQPTWRRGLIEGDQRTWLPVAMAEIIAQVQPKFCVMENVGGFMSALNGDVRNATHDAIVNAGYSIIELKVHAQHHGTAQNRSRYVLVGLRNKSVGGYRRAEALLADIATELEREPDKLLTIKDALVPVERFGVIPAGGGKDYLVDGGVETWNHYARPHNERDRKIYALLKPGETASDLDERQPGIIPYKLDTFHDKYRKLDSSQPSPTIPAHLKRDANSFILDGVNRGLTPREAALLQGFPRDYIFIGEQSHQFQQVGNAVPPPVAHKIGNLIKEALAKAKTSWKPEHMGIAGPKPSDRTLVMRQKIAKDRAAGLQHDAAWYLSWASRRFQTPKAALRPLIYRELARARSKSKQVRA